MEKSTMLQQIAAMRKKLFDEGVLDEQFNQLEEIYGNPKPLKALLTCSFEESGKTIGMIGQHLEKSPVDFIEVRAMLHKLKGTSATIGAKKVLMYVDSMREHCKNFSVDGAKASFEELKKAHDELKGTIDTYFQMKIQAGAA